MGCESSSRGNVLFCGRNAARNGGNLPHPHDPGDTLDTLHVPGSLDDGDIRDGLFQSSDTAAGGGGGDDDDSRHGNRGGSDHSGRRATCFDT